MATQLNEKIAISFYWALHHLDQLNYDVSIDTKIL